MHNYVLRFLSTCSCNCSSSFVIQTTSHCCYSLLAARCPLLTFICVLKVVVLSTLNDDGLIVLSFFRLISLSMCVQAKLVSWLGKYSINLSDVSLYPLHIRFELCSESTTKENHSLSKSLSLLSLPFPLPSGMKALKDLGSRGVSDLWG